MGGGAAQGEDWKDQAKWRQTLLKNGEQGATLDEPPENVGDGDLEIKYRYVYQLWY